VPVRVEAIPLSAGRRLRTLRGTVESVAAQAGDAGDDYLRVVLTEPSRAGLADDVRTRFENAVDVIVAPAEDTKHPKTEWTPDHTRRSPAELFGEYLREKSVVDPALVKLFAHFLEEAVAPDTTRD
jgi:DNA repair protein SbcD/Mre11